MNDDINKKEVIEETSLPAPDPLALQMINEIQAMLKGINETYKEFYHFKLFNIVDLDPMECKVCIDTAQQCLRCLVGFTKLEQ